MRYVCIAQARMEKNLQINRLRGWYALYVARREEEGKVSE